MKYSVMNPVEHAVVDGPVIVALAGMTDRILEPSVNCWIRKLPVTCTVAKSRN